MSNKNVKKIGGQGSIASQIKLLELNNNMLDKLSGLYHEFKQDGFSKEQIANMFGGMGGGEDIEDDEEEEEQINLQAKRQQNK